ncbi:MAG: ice-binding family protein [Desulfosporosinus sp.]|nr:ice-binding family protein [Desulfosporosinus sp.]
MKKNTTKKTLATLALACVTMAMTPFNAFAVTGVTTARIFGSDRVGTAIAVADAGWTVANTAILAPSADGNLVDALAAAPLAGKTSPILLTDNNTLTAATQAELVKLGVKNVYIVGAISQSVVDQVTTMGVSASVLKGADRTDTAAAIASKLTNPAGSFVVGYGSLPDALSVASYAAANNYSILVANPDGTLPASETAYKGATTYIIGGPTLVEDIPGATRLFGADRFATNQAVLNALTYTYGHVYVANGTDAHLVDSLVASSLAAESGAPIVLTDPDGDGAIAATNINSKLNSTAVVTALGGNTVVTDSTVAQFSSGPTSGSTTVPVTGLTLNQPTLALMTGGANGTLVATVAPSTATNQAVNWTTSNAAVATVVNGVVTPVGAGTATITATTQDGAMLATSVVTVSTGTTVAVTGLSLDQPTLALITGGTNGTLVATVAPSTATNQVVNWATSNAAVATVVNGVVTPVSAGTATITATTQDRGIVATSIVTVSTGTITSGGHSGGNSGGNFSSTPVAVTGVTLDQPTLALTIGGANGTILATVAPSTATNQVVTWTTSDAAVATVVNGVVTPVGAGTATITATTQDGNMIASTAVTVSTGTPVAVTGLTLNQPTLALMTGEANGTLIATVAPSTATNQVVTWTTSDAAVATVVNGVVTPVSIGTATITATTQDGSKVASSAVTVTAAIAPTIVNLGSAGDYAIFAKSGISSIPNSVITGDIGVGPIAATGITGFSLTADATNVFSTSTQVTGKVYAPGYMTPTPSNISTAENDMVTAYTDAAGRAANYTELYTGDISGKILTPGVYKWSTGVLINSDVTLNGGANDVFIFEIAGGITQANGTKIILTGGAQAKNIYWQAADTVAIGTGSHFEGIILGMKNITLRTNASINGRLLAQTAVTLDESTVVVPGTAAPTATPIITGTFTAGGTSVSGTAVAGSSVVLTLNGTAQAPVTADATTGIWTVNGLTLASNDVISVTAKASGLILSATTSAIVQ